MRSKRDQGFTLIELLVVVLVVGILAAIAVPAYTRQRDKAAKATTQQNLRNITTVVLTATENRQATIQNITGNGCTDCPCRSINTPTPGTMYAVDDPRFAGSQCGINWLQSVTKLAAAADEPLDSMKRLFTDGWGYPITFDENEGTYNPCAIGDRFASAGANHLYELGVDDIAITAQPTGFC